MDLKRIRYFVTVARLRNFTHAAEALRIAQPPLSRRIQELEDELGVVLIRRDTRPLTLTDAGKLFLEQSVALLQRTDAMVASVRSMHGEAPKRFVIGVVPASFHINIAQVIRRFASAQPHLSIGILELNSSEQLAALREHRIDVGFGRLVTTAEGISKTVLREEPFEAAVPGDHALAQFEGPVPLAALGREPFIVYNSGPRPSLADTILDALSSEGIPLERRVDVDRYETAIMMVAAGLGVTLVPSAGASAQLRGVAFRPLRESIVTPIVLAHRDDDGSDALAIMKRVLATYLGDQGYAIPEALERYPAALP